MLCVQVRNDCEYVATIESVTVRQTGFDARRNPLSSLDVVVEPDRREGMRQRTVRIIAPIGSSFTNRLIESLLMACGRPVSEPELDAALAGGLNGERVKCQHVSRRNPNMPWTICHLMAAT